MRSENVNKYDLMDSKDITFVQAFMKGLFANQGFEATYKRWTGSAFATGVPVNIFTDEDSKVTLVSNTVNATDVLNVLMLVKDFSAEVTEKDIFVVSGKEYIIKNILYYDRSKLLDSSVNFKQAILISAKLIQRTQLSFS